MAKSEVFQHLSVKCAAFNYPIYIGSHLFCNHGLLSQHVVASQVMIVTNATIAPLYLSSVQQALSEFQCDVVILPDGEDYKNQGSLFVIYDALIENKHHRDTTLIALGGGVIGDITGFAAATYQRGVGFIQLPTTLLSQVDASIGGKTAINHSLGKNMIGSFHQPQAVLIDVTTLSTLPEREFSAGFAEIIKYGLLIGGDFLQHIHEVLAKGYDSMSLRQHANLIAQCCHIKAKFVQEDERELGRRALLNLGHTFAHALEAYTNYQQWLHGEAVSIGLYCAARLSYELGYLDKSQLVLIDSLLASALLPRRIPKEIDLGKLQNLMFNDKKILNNKLRFVLIRAPGNCFIEPEITADSLRCVLMNVVEGEQP